MKKFIRCNQNVTKQPIMIVKFIVISKLHLKMIQDVTNLVTWLHFFNHMALGGSNYTQKAVYFNRGGVFYL